MRLLAALLVLVPVSVLSQSPEPAAAASPAPTAVEAPAPAAAPVATQPEWSIGAGVALDRVIIVDSGSLITLDTGPELTATVERRLSSRTWLAFGAQGSVYRADQDPGLFHYSRVALKGGVRRLLTPEGAPADVSLMVLGTASGSYGSWDFDGAAPRVDTALGLGAELGLAVERELSEGLSLRVATPLVGLWWGWQKSKYTGSDSVKSNRLGADVALSPRLELRLAF